MLERTARQLFATTDRERFRAYFAQAGAQRRSRGFDLESSAARRIHARELRPDANTIYTGLEIA